MFVCVFVPVLVSVKFMCVCVPVLERVCLSTCAWGPCLCVTVPLGLCGCVGVLRLFFWYVPYHVVNSMDTKDYLDKQLKQVRSSSERNFYKMFKPTPVLVSTCSFSSSL